MLTTLFTPSSTTIVLNIAVLLMAVSGNAFGADSILHAGTRVDASVEVTDAEVMLDGYGTPEHWPSNRAPVAVFTNEASHIVWDFKNPIRITAIAIQADANDSYRISTSTDGETFTPLWRTTIASTTGMRYSYVTGLAARARYVRLDCPEGDTYRAVSELRIFSIPPVDFPPRIDIRPTLLQPEDAIKGTQLYAWQMVVGLICAFLLTVVLPSMRSVQKQTALAGVVVVLGLFAWTKFGTLHGNSPLHVWDGYHYFMSSKYFDELGYKELYRCAAKAHRELGNDDAVDSALIRDLDTNILHPGRWTATPEGQCRAKFTAARWTSFKRDISTYEKLFDAGMPFTRSFIDHGFNGTPVHAAWLRLVTRHLPVSRGVLVGIAQIDNLCIVLLIGGIWWAFGPLAAAGFTVVMAIGFPWGYQWIGGSVGRFVWLLFAGLGLALLKKEKPLWGTLSLTIAGALRMFPFVFLGGAGLYGLYHWIRNRHLNPPEAKMLKGVVLGLLLSATFAGTILGYGSFAAFADTFYTHGRTELSNHMGLPVLTGWAVGDEAHQLYSPQLSDPDVIWKETIKMNRRARSPLWIFAMVASLLFVLYVIHRGYASWQAALATGPLLFSMHNMTSYDYVWLALMVPLTLNRLARLRWLIYYPVFTILVGLVVGHSHARHVWFSFAFFVLMIALMIHMWRDLNDNRVK